MVELNPEKIRKLFKRIKDSDDGKEQIEYLELLSKENYEAFKGNDADMNEYHKGYAFAIDNLIDLFRQCDQEAAMPAKATDFT